MVSLHSAVERGHGGCEGAGGSCGAEVGFFPTSSLPLTSGNISAGMVNLTGGVYRFRVFLHATDQSALENGISMDTLKKYAAEPEAQNGGGSLGNQTPVTPGVKGGLAKETH